jgi:hypothetical protein
MVKSRANNAASTTRKGWWLTAIIFALLIGIGWNFWGPATGYARTATAYSARVVCSCRFVAGRSLEDCTKDKLEGMELVSLVDDVAAGSVTARFPLLASDTAIYREGYGCVLQEREG